MIFGIGEDRSGVWEDENKANSMRDGQLANRCRCRRIGAAIVLQSGKEGVLKPLSPQPFATVQVKKTIESGDRKEGG